MTHSPAFLTALLEERLLAEQSLWRALSAGDDAAAQEARGRLDDLTEITSRNVDDRLAATG